MPNTNDTIKFSLQHGSGTAIKMQLPRTSTERQNTPHPIALAVNKSLAVFISKYVLKRSLQRKL